MKKIIPLLITFAAITFSAPVIHADEEAILNAMSRILPGRVVSKITPTAIPGINEVVNGGRVYYLTDDGKHLITGHIIDTQTAVDLTEPVIDQARLSLLNGIKESELISYGDKDLKHTVTVFTDIDCPYCARLHEQMDEYNKNGIRIRYMFYPRAGLKSSSYVKARNVWCADDQHQAMTDAKAGKNVATNDCENPIAEHMDLAGEFEVNATPSIITSDGDVIPGFVPPRRLAAALNARAARAAK